MTDDTMEAAAPCTSRPHLSSYAEKLQIEDPLAYGRYIRKITDIGEDPFIHINKGSKTSGYSTHWRDLPEVTYRDIIFYLVETHSFYTIQQMRAYKGTDAYRFVYSGWVTTVRSKKCDDSKIIVTGKVRHSQQPSKTPCYSWVCTTADGIVLYGHCTCKAGLGEVCSHIAALLFYIDETVFHNTNATTNQECCTSRLCQWIVPKQLDKLELKMVKDMDFSNPKSRHSQLKERCATPRKEVKQPTEEEQSQFFRSIAACNQTSKVKCKPAILSLQDEFAEEYMPKTDSLPQNLLQLRQSDKLQTSLVSLQDEAAEIMTTLRVTPAQATNLQCSTCEQTQSKLWHTHRAGRVTASNMHAATHTSVDKPSTSLVKRICYPHTLQFSSDATDWGKNKEKEARNMYKEHLKSEHIHVNVSDCGLFIHPDFPHLGATPDGIVECECCGIGVCEVKCPYTCKNNTISSGVVKCLQRAESGDLCIDKRHPYYYQIQCQIFLTEAKYCDFIVWTNKDLHIERVYPDIPFWNDVVVKATSLFKKVLLPELIGAYWTRSAHPEE
ncbi:uncharacterized protein LOC119733373 [Patiria miniata]|uniref:SWIM-type domain-containing protein n=1 Tax=Patiria miniata TaxID=46514 RepID=A0A914AGP7_PATMI|nr:uncharacterized protein LOC119733373 [Patiria miniata]